MVWAHNGPRTKAKATLDYIVGGAAIAAGGALAYATARKMPTMFDALDAQAYSDRIVALPIMGAGAASYWLMAHGVNLLRNRHYESETGEHPLKETARELLMYARNGVRARTA